MRLLMLLPAIVLFPLSHALTNSSTSSSKRGLIYVPSAAHPQDDYIWVSNSSDLTWYYNYDYYPSLVYENYSHFEFVPMLWGAPSSTSDISFFSNVSAQIVGGANITYAMSFNEPDGTSADGGSNVSPSVAAETWIRELEPLRKLGVKLGAPAVTGGSSGFTWLTAFFKACGGNCTADFIPIHWYGDFGGMASHIGQVQAAYPDLKVWVTEYAYEDQDLYDTQYFFNTSREYFDRLVNITRYAYFGAFRSDVSNVGPNVTMLTSKGLLTDIGSWYLGGDATGNIPDAATSSAAATATSNSNTTVAAAATSSWCCVPTAGVMGRPGMEGTLGVVSVLVSLIMLI